MESAESSTRTCIKCRESLPSSAFFMLTNMIHENACIKCWESHGLQHRARAPDSLSVAMDFKRVNDCLGDNQRLNGRELVPNHRKISLKYLINVPTQQLMSDFTFQKEYCDEFVKYISSKYHFVFQNHRENKDGHYFSYRCTSRVSSKHEKAREKEMLRGLSERNSTVFASRNNLKETNILPDGFDCEGYIGIAFKAALGGVVVSYSHFPHLYEVRNLISTAVISHIKRRAREEAKKGRFSAAVVYRELVVATKITRAQVYYYYNMEIQSHYRKHQNPGNVTEYR